MSETQSIPSSLSPATWATVRPWLTGTSPPWFRRGTGVAIDGLDRRRIQGAFHALLEATYCYDVSVIWDPRKVSRRFATRKRDLAEEIALVVAGTAEGLRMTVWHRGVFVLVGFQRDRAGRATLFVEFTGMNVAPGRAAVPSARDALGRLLELAFSVARAGRAEQVVLARDVGDPARASLSWAVTVR